MRFVVPPALRVPLVCLGLFLGTLLLFSRALGFGFTSYGDPRYLTGEPQDQASVTWASPSQADYWHPLTWLSHVADRWLYGRNALGHRLTSVLWHAADAVLVFLLARRLTGAFWTSALCAALFAWHPLRVESVVWIAERKDVMGGCFFLLTLWSYTVYAGKRPADPAAARACRALTLAVFAGGLMCSSSLVALPVVLLLFDFWPLRRGAASAAVRSADLGNGAPAITPWKELLREKVPFFLLALIGAVVALLIRTGNGASVLALPLGARLANAFVSVPRYLGKFLWPFDLAVCYPHPGHWSAGAVGAAVALVLAVTGVALWHARSRPWLLTGWGWFLVMLAPELGVVRTGFESMADRSTYLPIIGLQLAVLWTLREFAPLVRQSVRIGVAGVVLAGCAVRTWVQEGTWRDSQTLFEHTLAVTKRNDRAHLLLGTTLAAEGRLNEAELHARRAIALNPNVAADYDLLGDIQTRQGRIAEAGESYRRVLQLEPRNAKADYALGVLLLLQRQPDEAMAHFESALRRQPDALPALLALAQVETLRGRASEACGHFRQAIALQPKNAAAHFGLAVALEQLGRADEALASYTTVTDLQPADAAAHLRIGMILLGRNQAAEARTQFETALKLQPKFGAAYVALGMTADRAGHTEEAIASFQRALACDPNDAAAHTAWADALLRGRRSSEAIAHYQEALRLSPDDATLHARLGFALFFTGRRADAAKQWEEALRLDPNLPGLRQQLDQLRGK